MGRDYDTIDPDERKKFIEDDGPKKCRIPSERAAEFAACIIIEDRLTK